MNRTEQLLDQLAFHWGSQLRPRLEGLSDDEYLWRPVPDAWTVRGGTIDWASPVPDPAPVTTIAWRLVHIVVGCFGVRTHTHFGGLPRSYEDLAFAATSDSALATLDEVYGRWVAGVQSLDDQDLARPCGEPGWESYPMAALVLHINREVIHHGAEISLLRDLYLRR